MGQRKDSLRIIQELLFFTLSILAISLIFTFIVSPFVDFGRFRVFRRCVSISSAIALFIFLRYVHAKPVSWLGLISWKNGRKSFAEGISLGIAVSLFMASLYLFLGWWRISIHPDAWKVWRTLLGFIPAAILVGFLEELIFRGYVLQRLLTSFSKWTAVILSSASYALVHLRPNPVFPRSAFEIVGLFLFGCLLAFCVIHRKHLYLAIGLHASLAYWARVNKLLIGLNDNSMQWLTGTNRLVDGILSWFIFLLVAWAVARAGRAQTAGR